MTNPVATEGVRAGSSRSAEAERLRNFIDGKWVISRGTEFVPVHNPALGTAIAETPLSTAADVDAAVQAARRAFPAWSETPAVVRARHLYKFRALLEEHFDELARLVTTEHGKTLDE